MPTPDIHPTTIRLMRLMTGPAPSHERFAAPTIDPAQIDGLALGDLWALAHATEQRDERGPIHSPAAETARMVLELGRDREPAFRGTACRDYIDLIAQDAERKPETDLSEFGARWRLQRACFALVRCIDRSFEELGPVAERLAAQTGLGLIGFGNLDEAPLLFGHFPISSPAQRQNRGFELLKVVSAAHSPRPSALRR